MLYLRFQLLDLTEVLENLDNTDGVSGLVGYQRRAETDGNSLTLLVCECPLLVEEWQACLESVEG